MFATTLDAVGSAPAESSGTSLFELAAAAPNADRTVFAEYHAAASREGIFMVQDARYKYVHCVTYPPQLFDRHNDPEESRDVSVDAADAPVLRRMEAALRARLDPVALDARVKQRQAEVLEAAGGWEFAIKRGDLPFSPPPGVAASWS